MLINSNIGCEGAIIIGGALESNTTILKLDLKDIY